MRNWLVVLVVLASVVPALGAMYPIPESGTGVGQWGGASAQNPTPVVDASTWGAYAIAGYENRTDFAAYEAMIWDSWGTGTTYWQGPGSSEDNHLWGTYYGKTSPTALRAWYTTNPDYLNTYGYESDEVSALVFTAGQSGVYKAFGSMTARRENTVSGNAMYYAALVLHSAGGYTLVEESGLGYDTSRNLEEMGQFTLERGDRFAIVVRANTYGFSGTANSCWYMDFASAGVETVVPEPMSAVLLSGGIVLWRIRRR